MAFNGFVSSANGDEIYKTESELEDEKQELSDLIKKTKQEWSQVKLFFETPWSLYILS